MLQVLTEQHEVDAQGNPAGGKTTAVGIGIVWQDGPIPRDDDGQPMQSANGAFVEGVIQAAIGRLQFYQGSKFSCRENALALTKLQEALHWMQERTARRVSQGIEGTHSEVDGPPQNR